MSLPEIVANMVLDELRILTPEDLQMLEKIAIARRALVVYEPLKGSEARLLSIPGKRSIITISSADPYRPRQRFGIAHELGHLEMHRRQLNSISCTTQQITPFKNNATDIELQANQFASYFLLPGRFVKPIFEDRSPSFDLLEEAATLLDVSLTAAGSRYMRFTEEPMAFVVSSGGRITRFVSSQLFEDSDLFIKVGDELECDTIADKLLRGHTCRPGWYSIPATSWLTGDNIMRDAQVKEWSFFSQKFDMTLSLIWVDEELYDE